MIMTMRATTQNFGPPTAWFELLGRSPSVPWFSRGGVHAFLIRLWSRGTGEPVARWARSCRTDCRALIVPAFAP